MYDPYYEYYNNSYVIYAKLLTPKRTNFTQSYDTRSLKCCGAAAPVQTVQAYHTMVGTLIVVTIYLQLIQNTYMFRSFTVLHCSHQHCVQPVASDVEVVGYL